MQEQSLDNIFCKHTIQKILKIQWGKFELTPYLWYASANSWLRI